MYQGSGPPPTDGSYNTGYMSQQGYPSYGPGYGQYYGQQGYPGVPQQGFPIMGGQPQYGAVMQPQGVPPPHQYAAVVDHGTTGQWGLTPVAQSYDQHGGDSHGQANVDHSSSSRSKAGDRKSQAADDADRKREKGHSKSSDKQRSSSHDDRKSSHGGHTRDNRDSSHDRHPRDGDGKKSTKQKKDDDREAGKLARQNIDALLQDDQLKNILFAGISKATAKLEQSLKTADKKSDNYASTDDSTSRHKAQQSAQTSSADVPQKPKSILKRKTGEERVVESKISTESQVSSDSFSKLSVLEKTLHLLRSKTNLEDVVRGSEKGSRGSEKPSFKPAGALSQLESYNDSGDDNDHAEKDTKKQTKTKKNAPSTQPFWSADAVPTGKEKDKDSELPDIQEQLYEQWRKSINLSSKVRQAASKEQDVNQLSQQTVQTHNLASSSQAKKSGDDEEELDSTVQNILQSIGFNFDLSKRMQELARQKKKQNVLHTGMINQSASFLEQSEGLVQDVRSALFSDKQEKAQLDSLIKEARASMQQRSSYERSASPDALSAEDQRGRSSYGHKGGNADPDDGRNRMGLGSREIRSDRVLENFSNQGREEISQDIFSSEAPRGKKSRKGKGTETDDGRSKMGLGSHEIRSDQTLNLNRQDWEQISPDTFSSEAQRGKKGYSRKGKGLEADDGRSKMGLGSREIRGDRIMKLNSRQEWEEISSDEDDIGEIASLKKTEKMKRLSYEKHAEIRQQSVSRERDVSSPPHSSLLDEAQKLKNVLRGSHEKSLWLSERFKDEPKDEYFYRDDSESSKAAALFAALSSKRKEVSSSSSKSLKLPLQSGSVRVENLRVTSRTVHSDVDEPYIESRKVILPSKSDVRIVSQTPVFRKSQSPETKVHRKRPASPPLFPVSKERRVFNEKGSINDLQAFLMRSLEENAPEICQALGLDVDSYFKSPMLQNVLGGLNVSGQPVSKRAESPIMSGHLNRDSVRKSLDRQTLRSPDIRTSRSPGRHLSRSPKRQKSRSPVRQMSWSPGRRMSKSTDIRKSRSPDRRKSRSPDRRLSISPKRRKSVSPGRHTSRSPDRRRSISLERRRSRSPDRRRSRSPDRRRSKSFDRLRSKSPDRRRSRSPDRRRSKSFDRRRSKSPDRRRSRSLDRRRSRSLDRRRSRSPDRRRSRSPDRRRSRSPGRQRSRSPGSRRSRSLERRKSRSPARIRSPLRVRPRSPVRRRSITSPFMPAQTRPFDRLNKFAKHRFPVRERRTPPPNQTTAFKRQLPANKKQDANRGTKSKMSTTSDKIKQPAKTNVPATSTEDRKGLPASQSKELSEAQMKGLLKEQPKEHVQELPKLQDKEPETGQEEQQDGDSSKIALKNDIKTEVDTLEELPVDERKMILIKSYDQHGGDSHGRDGVDRTYSSFNSLVDARKFQARDHADRKHQSGYSKSSYKQHISSSHANWKSSRDCHSRLDLTSSRGTHPHGNRKSSDYSHPPDDEKSSHGGHPHDDQKIPHDSHPCDDLDSSHNRHSCNGDRQKSTKQKIDDDWKAGKLARQYMDALLQDDKMKNIMFAFAGISKATAKFEPSMKTTDGKFENYVTTDDSTSRHKAQQSVQTSSAEGPQKPQSLLKQKTGEERVDVESKVGTESQVSSDSFSKLSALWKPPFKPVGALSHLESCNDNDSGDDNDHRGSDGQAMFNSTYSSSNYKADDRKSPATDDADHKQEKGYSGSSDKQRCSSSPDNREDSCYGHPPENLASSHDSYPHDDPTSFCGIHSQDREPVSILKKTTGEERVYAESKTNSVPAVKGKGKNGEFPDIWGQLYEQRSQSFNNPSKVWQATYKEPDVPKLDHLFQYPGEAHNGDSSSRTKKAGDNDEELNSTVQNILQSVGFSKTPSTRIQDDSTSRHKAQQYAMQTRSQQGVEQPEMVVSNSLPGKLRIAQSMDATLQSCFRNFAKSADPPKHCQYYMKNRLLYRRDGQGEHQHGQLVVPKDYRSQLLHMGHTIPFIGHISFGATLQRLSCHYYWPGMADDVHWYVKSCPVCHRVVPKHWTAPMILDEMPIMNLFERVAISIVGSLPQTRKRNMYILTMVDCCSMWSEAIPLATIDSKSVANALMGSFTRLGFPNHIQTDNGPHFCGKLMEEVFHIFRTNHIHTSPYHPHYNGQVEKFNGTLMTMLDKLAQEKPDRWDEYIPAALYTYREIPHVSTGWPPATLLFGRPIKGPLEALLRCWTEKGISEEVVSSYKYVKELKKKFETGWVWATQNLRKARKRHAAYNNKKTKDRSFQVGDRVLLLLPIENNKLEIGWQGPFPVERVVSRTNYEIRIRGKSKSSHINLLKKYEERSGDSYPHLMAMET